MKLTDGGVRVKVYNCFTFFNELELLELRLKLLDNVVDYFVLIDVFISDVDEFSNPNIIEWLNNNQRRPLKKSRGCKKGIVPQEKMRRLYLFPYTWAFPKIKESRLQGRRIFESEFPDERHQRCTSRRNCLLPKTH